MRQKRGYRAPYTASCCLSASVVLDAGQILGELAVSLLRPSPEGWPRARKVQASWGVCEVGPPGGPTFKLSGMQTLRGHLDLTGCWQKIKFRGPGCTFEIFWTTLLVVRRGEFQNHVKWW